MFSPDDYLKQCIARGDVKSVKWVLEYGEATVRVPMEDGEKLTGEEFIELLFEPVSDSRSRWHEFFSYDEYDSYEDALKAVRGWSGSTSYDKHLRRIEASILCLSKTYYDEDGEELGSDSSEYFAAPLM